MNDISRRDFVAGAATIAACALTIRGVPALAAAQPTDGPADKKPAAKAPEKFDAGELKSFEPGINDKLAKTKGVFIVKDDKGYLYCVSGTCTHQGGLLKLQDGALMCPKHKATFDSSGKVTKGPAKQDLPRYGVAEKDGHLWVDTNIIFLPGDFAKDGAWVKG